MSNGRYVNPPLITVSILNDTNNHFRTGYDLYGLARLDTLLNRNPNALFTLSASFNFEPIAPEKARCSLIILENGNLPAPHIVAMLLEQLKQLPNKLILAVNYGKPSNNTLEAEVKAQFQRDIKLIQVAKPLTNDTVNTWLQRGLLFQEMEKNLVYSALLKSHLTSDELYATHTIPDAVTSIITDYVDSIAPENFGAHQEQKFSPALR